MGTGASVTASRPTATRLCNAACPSASVEGSIHRQTGCPICGSPLTQWQTYCSGKCRVAAFRAKHAPVKVRVENDYQSERRSAVTGCTTGQTLLRDVGRDTDALRMKEHQRRYADDCKKLRADSAKERRRIDREIKKFQKDCRWVLESLKEQRKRLTPQLKDAITRLGLDLDSQDATQASAISTRGLGQLVAARDERRRHEREREVALQARQDSPFSIIKNQGGTTETTLRSYPRQVRTLARKYDTLLRKLTTDFNDTDYSRLGRLGDELAFRCMWGR